MLTREQISKAAQWWVKVIQNPKFDNGDGMQSAVMTLAASTRTSLQDANLMAFETALEDALLKAQEEDQLRHVGCDYDPDLLLRACAAKTGIDMKCFPCKTHMYFGTNKIEVSYGYRAPLEVIA